MPLESVQHEHGYRGSQEYRAQISSTGPEILCHVSVASSLLLSAVFVTQFKQDFDCSLVDLVSFLPTTQLHKREGYMVVCLYVFDAFLFLITCFRQGSICYTFISMTNSVACLQRNQAPPGCLPDFPLTRRGCQPSTDSFPLSPGSCSVGPADNASNTSSCNEQVARHQTLTF